MADNVNGHSDLERRTFEKDLLANMPRLRIYALSLTRDRDKADDLVQETLFKALAGRASFAAGTNLAAWSFRIMRNEFISEVRVSRRSNHHSLDEIIPKMGSRLVTDPNAQQILELSQMLQYLACIERNQADLLIAAGYLVLPYDDLAERFKCSVGTIKSRISRGRDALHALMQDSILANVDVSWFKTATRGVPKSHPRFPIYQAYEELYAEVDGKSHGLPSLSTTGAPATKHDKLWDQLVASGALDEDGDDLSELSG